MKKLSLFLKKKTFGRLPYSDLFTCHALWFMCVFLHSPPLFFVSVCVARRYGWNTFCPPGLERSTPGDHYLVIKPHINIGPHATGLPRNWVLFVCSCFLALCILFSPPRSKTSPVCYDQLLSSNCLLRILPFVFDCWATCSFFWTLGIRVCGQRLYFHLSSVSYSTTIVLSKHRRNMELSITS